MAELSNQILGLERIKEGVSPVPVSEDNKAAKEEEELFGDKRRKEEKKQHFHKAFIRLVNAVSIAFILVFSVRMIHFVLPENNSENAKSCWVHGWLSEVQLQGMDKLFFSGAMGALVARYLKDAVGEGAESDEEKEPHD